MIHPDDIQFDEKGLVPAILQDAASKEVLTLAYMNREALAVNPEVNPQKSYNCQFVWNGLKLL